MLLADRIMPATIEISLPDALVNALGTDRSELPRQTIEALVIQSYRAGKISHAQVAEMLALDRWQTDAFLTDAQAFRPWEPAEFAQDLATLRNLTK